MYGEVGFVAHDPDVNIGAFGNVVGKVFGVAHGFGRIVGIGFGAADVESLDDRDACLGGVGMTIDAGSAAGSDIT